MSTPLSKSLCLSSSLSINKEATSMEKQGIVTILRSDCERTKAASLRRTLSADMSSKKWLAQNGLSQAMKKTASSEQLLLSLADSSSLSGEDDCEERKEQLEGKEQKEELEKPGQFDIWSSIVSQKDNQDTPKVLPPPYTHPLAKRSASSLSGKSLEICTESLGSETGSDGFSSDPSAETEDVEEEKVDEEVEEEQQQQNLKMFSQAFDHREELRVAKYHHASTEQKSKPKSFPPPLPSLTRKDGASLLMQTHRDNGRLVLEAVTVPSQNQFHSERQDGRLVLTFLSSLSSEDAKDEKWVEGDQQQEEEEEEEEEEVNKEVLEGEFEDFEEVYDGDEGGHVENELEGEEVESFDDENVPKGMEIVIIEKEPKLSSRAISVYRLIALTVNKQIRIADMMNPSVTKSLPPHPLVARLMPLSPHDAASSSTAAAAVASFNSYEYYWWAEPTANPITQQLPTALQSNGNKPIISKIPIPNEQRQLFVLRGNRGDYSGPLVKGCKKPRRSLLLWEPNWIATS
ncbi:protein FAF-like, chloroplastic [Juglans microcarpa x Juglans regia]|uniref:protein FAF-like, chloroplastic n=1 Tax=Juglans microcarpa x Juglans regia TaxID=2249226 RepID=UPI001B7DA63F|nr:protein FAF-like, chloroplastic [Juglans microcarpa x Juglans regia]